MAEQLKSLLQKTLRFVIPLTYVTLFYFFRDKTGTFVFLGLGIGCSWAGLHIWNSNRRIIENGFKTKGKIIAFKEEIINDMDRVNQKYYFPVVQFTDRNGMEVTQKLENSGNPKRIRKPIEIIYWKKDDEYEIIENNLFWKTYFPIIFISAGILLAGIGIAVIIKEF